MAGKGMAWGTMKVGWGSGMIHEMDVQSFGKAQVHRWDKV